MAGDVDVPRFTVWLTWLAPVQLLLMVTWFAVALEAICRPCGWPPVGYAQAWVLLRNWVDGFAAKVDRKVCITVGLSAESGAMVLRPVVSVPVVWSRPCT